MPAIEWNKSYSVNIPSLDEQHKKLFTIFNKTQDMIKSGKSESDLNEIFQDAINYALEHFNYEEKLMFENRYEKLSEHKLDHEKFIETVNNYISRFRSTDSVHPQPVEVLGFLIDWLQNHILKRDKEYSSYLESKGVI